jgi:HTH-type transcriptional regulator / antitoxin HipB
VDYPIKTLGQLRPILQGFRKTAGLTQAGMASHLGVTQQTYAQLEANPAAVSVDRLFRVLQVLRVDLTLIPRAAGSPESDAVVADTMPLAPVTPVTQAARKTVAPRSTKQDSTATARNMKSKTQTSSHQKTPSATPARAKNPQPKATPRSTARPKSVGKKREDW